MPEISVSEHGTVRQVGQRLVIQPDRTKGMIYVGAKYRDHLRVDQKIEFTRREPHTKCQRLGLIVWREQVASGNGHKRTAPRSKDGQHKNIPVRLCRTQQRRASN